MSMSKVTTIHNLLGLQKSPFLSLPSVEIELAPNASVYAYIECYDDDPQLKEAFVTDITTKDGYSLGDHAVWSALMELEAFQDYVIEAFKQAGETALQTAAGL